MERIEMTLLAIQLFLKNAFGWAYANWRIVLGVFLLVFVFAFVHRQCNRPPKVQLNEKELQQVKQAIETQERRELEEAYVLVEVKQEEINANVANGRVETINKTTEARKEAQGMSIEELEAYLEGMAR
jgi:hypothetical protein